MIVCIWWTDSIFWTLILSFGVNYNIFFLGKREGSNELHCINHFFYYKNNFTVKYSIWVIIIVYWMSPSPQYQ